MALLGTGAANAGIAAVLVPGTTYYVSVNSASPGTTGANELTSTTRAAVTFGSASGGAEASNSTATVTNPGTTAATHCSIWSAVTAGTYLVGSALASTVTAASITFASGSLTFAVT